jgi:hypothetical protein
MLVGVEVEGVDKQPVTIQTRSGYRGARLNKGLFVKVGKNDKSDRAAFDLGSHGPR